MTSRSCCLGHAAIRERASPSYLPAVRVPWIWEVVLTGQGRFRQGSELMNVLWSETVFLNVRTSSGEN